MDQGLREKLASLQAAVNEPGHEQRVKEFEKSMRQMGVRLRPASECVPAPRPGVGGRR